MKYKVFVRLMLCLVTTIIGCSKPSVGENEAKQAMDVIKRYAEGQSLPVEIAVTLDKHNGCDVYETSVKNGTLSASCSLITFKYLTESGLKAHWYASKLIPVVS